MTLYALVLALTAPAQADDPFTVSVPEQTWCDGRLTLDFVLTNTSEGPVHLALVDAFADAEVPLAWGGKGGVGLRLPAPRSLPDTSHGAVEGGIIHAKGRPIGDSATLSMSFVEACHTDTGVCPFEQGLITLAPGDTLRAYDRFDSLPLRAGLVLASVTVWPRLRDTPDDPGTRRLVSALLPMVVQPIDETCVLATPVAP